MKYLKAFSLILLTVLISSCTNDLEEEDKGIDITSFEIKSTGSTDDSIQLEWDNIEKVSWFFVEYNIVGGDKEMTAGSQDLKSDKFKKEIFKLEPGKEYEIRVIGKDYLSGGDILAKSNTIKVSTKQKE